MKRYGKGREAGVLVKSVARSSPFFRAGLRGGDIIRSINGEVIYNELDFYYFSAEAFLRLEVVRENREYSVDVIRKEGAFSGITLVERPVTRCANRCVFCFIDQMPPGLRRSLYVKDEDLRLSLLNGNYVTLSSFGKRELERIARIGLSPLYISVHATDTVVRRRMLGNSKAPDVMRQLRFLRDGGTVLHTQIVVCPGWNDGSVLQKTVNDLLSLGTPLHSIAVVPVGLTRFRKKQLVPVGAHEAKNICRMISGISCRAMKKDGSRKLFLADEFFLKAGISLPDAEYYESYPQIGNGVGIVRQYLDEWESVKTGLKKIRKRLHRRRRRILLVTSVSAFRFVDATAEDLRDMKLYESVATIAVVNSFFGESVTVAGLLTASDIIRQVRKKLREFSCNRMVLPSVLFNYNGYSLDGYSAGRIEKTIGVPVKVVENVEELVGL